jgi:hypothetical protein
VSTEVEEDPVGTRWSQLRQDVAAVGWTSFLAASVATMVFFAFFDPLYLGLDDDPPVWATHRMTGYGLGFFFFWAVCAASSALTAYLLRTRRREEPPGDTPSWMRDAP